MPPITETVIARDREAWRKWLKKHGAAKKEIWLVFYKKHTRKPCVSYDEAVEEALCFGWIDGIMRRIDDEKHANRFTPRQPKSIWSESNRKRAQKMIREGRMTEAGLALIQAAKKSGAWDKAVAREWDQTLPAEFAAALARNKKASENFSRLAPSHRKMYVLWILDAKQAETRARRSEKAIRLLMKNEKLGMV